MKFAKFLWAPFFYRTPPAASVSTQHNNIRQFNMFTTKGFSETRPFVHLSKQVLWSQQVQKYLSYEAHFFSKCSKFNVDSKYAIKNWQKVFRFSYNCIWIGTAKFSLLVREYSWLAVNVLRLFFAFTWKDLYIISIWRRIVCGCCRFFSFTLGIIQRLILNAKLLNINKL